MPKDRRKRVGGHDPSVKLVKRQFAVQDNAVEHVEVGGAAEQSAAAVLSAINAPIAEPALKKKEKQQLKREALLQRLESSHSPYSKSHARRQKRKAKEQIGGGLDEIQLALAAVDDDDSAEVPEESAGPTADEEAPQQQKKIKPKPGQIGEGKGAPLSKAQRQRALQMEKLRHPLILANAEFSSNPFQTIRTHAQNTLLQH
ncbi:ribosome biogenesis protein SLX9-domain-containing protein [Mycena epipterygia]|nr:ribosome biogenesis protein SLX9-domain-containing protein [Mycena epipterygia]